MGEEYNEDNLVQRIVSSITDKFKKEAEPKPEPTPQPKDNLADIKSIKDLPENIQKLVAEAIDTEVNATVDKIAAKAKAKAVEELEKQDKELEAKGKALTLQKKMQDIGIDDKYKDFITYQLGEDGDIEKFIENNPQYLKENPLKQPTGSNSSYRLSPEEKRRLELLDN